jgi:hypothetical protein
VVEPSPPLPCQGRYGGGCKGVGLLAPFIDQWMGLRTGRKAGTECGRLSRLRLRKGSTVEGTSGAADQTTFREDVWEATLRYIMRQCDVPGELIRKRPTHRTVAQSQRFPDDTGHQLATGGVRVKQVGVKPPRRAVAVVVVVEFGATQPLGW